MTLKNYYTEAESKPNMLYFEYRFFDEVMLCAIDIVKHSNHISIFITNPACGKGSTTNNIEVIANNIYLRLRLENIVSNPGEITWYEVLTCHRKDDFYNFLLQKVKLEWNGVAFNNPSWDLVNPNEVPLNFSDFIPEVEILETNT